MYMYIVCYMSMYIHVPVPPRFEFANTFLHTRLNNGWCMYMYIHVPPRFEGVGCGGNLLVANVHFSSLKRGGEGGGREGGGEGGGGRGK